MEKQERALPRPFPPTHTAHRLEKVKPLLVVYCLYYSFVMDLPVPVVSGISPREGPPGTKVTIRGENLGINKKDVLGELAWRP